MNIDKPEKKCLYISIFSNAILEKYTIIKKYVIKYQIQAYKYGKKEFEIYNKMYYYS